MARRGKEQKSRVAGLLLLLLFRGEVVATELALELLHAAGGVDKGLLPREERVRAGPDFHVQLRHGRADGHHDLAVVVDLALGVVAGVNLVLHDSSPCRWGAWDQLACNPLGSAGGFSSRE